MVSPAFEGVAPLALGPQPVCPQNAAFPQQPVADGRGSLLGQFPHDVDATVWLMALQNAFPNASSAHAIQLDGSPEHEAMSERCEPDDGSDTGKMGLNTGVGFGVRRRKGTGG